MSYVLILIFHGLLTSHHSDRTNHIESFLQNKHQPDLHNFVYTSNLNYISTYLKKVILACGRENTLKFWDYLILIYLTIPSSG